MPFEGEGYYMYPRHFDYDEDLEVVASVVRNTVEKISDSLPEP